jgi:hypothetical protein
MHRLNPGPFEPLVYLIQTATFFRLVGIGGMAIFSICFLYIAASHGLIWAVLGLGIAGVFWLESSLTVCRRCRFYGTWHCLGQGYVASRLFDRRPPGLSTMRTNVHLGLLGLYLAYGLFWLWHRPLIGLAFTLWIPLLLLSATTPRGFSWRQPSADLKLGRVA